MTVRDMNKIMKYIPKKQKHKEWTHLLKKFGSFLNNYNDPPKEVAYWYGEHAITALLSTAAWSIKGWSLKEFTGLRRKGRNKIAGRGDLWIGIGSKKYTVEAKIIWPNKISDKTIEMINNTIKKAKNQIELLDKEYREGFKTVVCYVVPELKKSSNHNFEHIFKSLADNLMKENTQTMVGSFWYWKNVPEFNGRLYPGIIVVVRHWATWEE